MKKKQLLTYALLDICDRPLLGLQTGGHHFRFAIGGIPPSRLWTGVGDVVGVGEVVAVPVGEAADAAGGGRGVQGAVHGCVKQYIKSQPR